jgi:hypothetical protein
MIGAISLSTGAAVSAAEEANYDEARVPSYSLPDPLRLENGKRVRTAAQWRSLRRPELLELFRRHVYGRSPGPPQTQRLEVTARERQALHGRAIRKEISIHLTGDASGPRLDLLLFVPTGATGPVPAFLGLNFEGNAATHSDPAIQLTRRWMREAPGGRTGARGASEASRGAEASRWQVEKVLSRGYALATAYYGDIEPDHADGWRDGVRAVFPTADCASAVPSPTPIRAFAPDDWGAIGAWAWGLSRALDYLETDPDIDARRVAVIGHSRLGKTALWAGAQDERFALVISNNSGEGGAALARRRFGETTERINRAFPHWFCANFKRYGNREDEIPVDQHQLIALIAPRPVYIASAEKDLWADPKGEFLAARHAGPVYALFGRGGVGVEQQPALNQPVGGVIGYHTRTGAHDVTAYDWEQYLDFADRHLRKGGR